MMNGRGFRTYQSMNMVHRSKDGDYMAASNVSLLKQKNITNVLTSAAMLDISYNKEHQINHKVINAFDVPTYKITPHFEEAFRFIDQSMKRGHLLVHCAAGISRSTTFVLVYLMRSQKMSFQHALGYVRSKRSVVNPNYGFQNQLKKYELELRNNQGQERQKEEPSTTLNYDSFKSKRPVFQFMTNSTKRPLANEGRFSSTTASKHNGADKSYGSRTNGSNFLRGKSLNYNSQINNKFQLKDHKSNINRLANGLLSYKLQVPRIATIKR